MAQDRVFSPTLIPSLDNEVKVCHADELLDPLLCNSIVKILNYHTEPYRVCRRLSILRECSDDQIKIYP
ncbi:hypothetical protein KPZ59_00997 [Acinetobacter baumannii]|nr:hypothetical protein KPZ59_00997 [Acinetobacter baumannii]